MNIKWLSCYRKQFYNTGLTWNKLNSIWILPVRNHSISAVNLQIKSILRSGWIKKKFKQWNVVTDLIQSDIASNKDDIWLLRVVILFALCQYLHSCPYFYHSYRIFLIWYNTVFKAGHTPCIGLLQSHLSTNNHTLPDCTKTEPIV